ncbi:MAG: putative toxin-antitoxin system toxin component, PIN family [Candidatus Moranbacteria bacterium]|nr:putative toxin-antitoxin system toxin component, PIN family [Candidatus Moranbacteria bacterium]
MKLVIDTNLFVAAFFNKKSSSYKILQASKEGRLDILWSREIRGETDKIIKNVGSQKGFLDEFMKPENEVKNAPKINIIKDCPADNKFLACAAAGRADYILSNDHHLLDLKKFRGIPTLTPSGFLKRDRKLIM